MSEKRTYRDRVCVITGAGSGIGRALSVELAGRGARLALSDVDQLGLTETARLCTSAGSEPRTYRVDVAEREAVVAHSQAVVQDFGTVHLVVNNAGVALHGPVSEISEQDFHWVMDIDFWGVVHGTQAFLPHLMASGDGQLANVSSVFGLIGVPKQAAYNAAKFAVRGFTEALRQEMALAQAPVAVSCIHPGGIRTEIARRARTTASEDKATMMASFDKVARTSPPQAARIILKGLERDKPRILVGPDAWFLAALPRVLGSGYGRVVARAASRLES